MTSSSLEVPRRRQPEKRSRLWRLLVVAATLAVAVGWLVWFLRTPADLPTSDESAEGSEDVPLEVLLSHPTGFLEAMMGEIRGPRIEIATQGLLKMESAKDYRRGHRLYGLVNGELMWVYEMEAMGQPLQPHISAALKRVPPE